MIEVKVPSLGESISEATIAKWIKLPGDAVVKDDVIAELETDKVTVEVLSPANGVLKEVKFEENSNVDVDAVLVLIEEGAQASSPAKSEAPKTVVAPPQVSSAPAQVSSAPAASVGEGKLSPAVRKIIAEHGLEGTKIAGTGSGGRITREDVLAVVEKQKSTQKPVPVVSKERPPSNRSHLEERVRMTRLRQTVARRLKQAQNNAAMLTTFNEVDMTNVMKLREEYKDLFLKKHNVKLGFMSFFVKAATFALQELPAVNAEIDGDDIIYKNYYDIGVAVGSPMGLVVPVVRDVDQMEFWEIEKSIGDYGVKARDGKIKPADMVGGTFTISNGGIYGSLMSTPILNPPQSGILGMHKIQQRPVVVDGKIEIRPMMYIALSYDHRIIDGKEAVTFLIRLRDCVEDPRRLLLNL